MNNVGLFSKHFDFLLKEFGEDVYIGTKIKRVLTDKKRENSSNSFWSNVGIWSKDEIDSGVAFFYEGACWYSINQKTLGNGYSYNVIQRADWLVSYYDDSDRNNLVAYKIPTIVSLTNFTVERDSSVATLKVIGKIVTKDYGIIMDINKRIVVRDYEFSIIGRDNSKPGLIEYTLEAQTLAHNEKFIDLPWEFQSSNVIYEQIDYDSYNNAPTAAFPEGPPEREPSYYVLLNPETDIDHPAIAYHNEETFGSAYLINNLTGEKTNTTFSFWLYSGGYDRNTLTTIDGNNFSLISSGNADTYLRPITVRCRYRHPITQELTYAYIYYEYKRR